MRVDYPRSEHTGVRRFLPSWKQFLALVAVGFLSMVALVGVAYAKTDIPTPNELAGAQTTVVYYSNGKTEIGRFGDQNRINVTIDKVPEHVQQAVLAAEDRSFYENNGISPTGIGRAFWNNLKGGSTQGGSTITQQYAKNVYLTQERTYTRKAKEFLIAVKLDQRDNKDKILQDYLNVIYFGRRAYGIQTASETYFNKPVGDLTLAEGAVLAAIIRSPARYDPANHPDELAGQVRLRARRHGRQGLARRVRAGEAEAPRRGAAEEDELRQRHQLLPAGHRAPRAQGQRLHRPGDRRRRPEGHQHVPAQGPARGGARGPDRAAQGEGEGRAHRALGSAAGRRRGDRDVRRGEGGRPQRGDPGHGCSPGPRSSRSR